MSQQTIITLVFIGLLISLYIINGRKVKEYDESVKRYDLIIKFNESCYRDIRNIKLFSDIASWSKYGDYGFRGMSLLNKEEVEQLLQQQFNINKENYHVICATDLYMPS